MQSMKRLCEATCSAPLGFSSPQILLLHWSACIASSGRSSFLGLLSHQEDGGDDEQDTVVSAEALEKERARKATQWKQQQLAQGVTAEDNPNLQVRACSLLLIWIDTVSPSAQQY